MTYIIEYAKYHRLKKWHAFHFFSLKTFVSQFAKLDFICIVDLSLLANWKGTFLREHHPSVYGGTGKI